MADRPGYSVQGHHHPQQQQFYPQQVPYAVQQTPAYPYALYPPPPSAPIHQPGLQQFNIHPQQHQQMPGSVSTNSSSAPTARRPFRQRRKDPSCDACRERKVKCDATDASACSECTSRKLKCQFTKDNSRRMSSLKQVQDLEKQLARARAHIAALSSTLDGGSVSEAADAAVAAAAASMSFDPGSPGSVESSASSPPSPILSTRHTQSSQTVQGSGSVIPEILVPPNSVPRPPRLTANHDFSDIRKFLAEFNRGVFKPPAPYRCPEAESYTANESTSGAVTLPPKEDAVELIAAYYDSLHSWMPIVHWQTFLSQFENLYSSGGDLRRVSPAWVSTFFAILACGMFSRPFHGKEAAEAAVKAREYIVASRNFTYLFNDSFNLDHCRSALLVAIFLVELNYTSAAWTWLSAAVRKAQDLGLHRELSASYAAAMSGIEIELRRRVWWAIYVWDRILASELGRPYLISDDDCNVQFPAPVDCHCITDDGIISLASAGDGPDQNVDPESSTACHFIPLIHILRILSPLRKTLRSAVIARTTLSTFDGYFVQFWTAFPFLSPAVGAIAREFLEPQSLIPIMVMQDLRLILHRHNLSPYATSELRSNALDNGAIIGIETVAFLQRTMMRPHGPHPMLSRSMRSPENFWADRMAESMCAFQLLHIWRATLFLISRGLFRHARVCVKVSAAVHDHRQVNLACGRYLEGVLLHLRDSLEDLENSDNPTAHYVIEEDEDMIALVSGDLQAWADSWIWEDQQPEPRTSNAASAAKVPPAFDSSTADATDDEPWNKWTQLDSLMQKLDQSLVIAHAREVFVRRALDSGLVLDLLNVERNMADMMVSSCMRAVVGGREDLAGSRLNGKSKTSELEEEEELKDENEDPLKMVRGMKLFPLEKAREREREEKASENRETKRARISIANII